MLLATRGPTSVRIRVLHKLARLQATPAGDCLNQFVDPLFARRLQFVLVAGEFDQRFGASDRSWVLKERTGQSRNDDLLVISKSCGRTLEISIPQQFADKTICLQNQLLH